MRGFVHIRRKATENSTRGLFAQVQIACALHPQWFIIEMVGERRGGLMTYAEDGWIIGDSGRLLIRSGSLLNAKVLHVTPSEDDVLVDLRGWRYLLIGLSFSALGAKGANIFEGNSRVLRVNLVENADIAWTGLLAKRRD